MDLFKDQDIAVAIDSAFEIYHRRRNGGVLHHACGSSLASTLVSYLGEDEAKAMFRDSDIKWPSGSVMLNYSIMEYNKRNKNEQI